MAANDRRSGTSGVATASRVPRQAVIDAGERAADARSPWLVLLLGPAAAGWTILVGAAIAAVPCFALWMAGAPLGTPWTVPARQAGIAWVAGHAVAVQIDDVTISLLPWGTLIIPALLLIHAGHWTARLARLRSIGAWIALATIAGLGYGAALGTAARMVATPAAMVSGEQATVVGVLLGVPCVLAGACRAPSMRTRLRIAVPATVRASVAGGLIALGSLAVAGVVLVLASVIANFARVLTAWQRLDPDVLGACALVLLCLAYLPVFATWALAFALGPGISVLTPMSIFAATPAGSAVSTGLTASTDSSASSGWDAAPAVADLPVFPLFAAVPQSIPFWAPMLPLLGVLAGVVAGIVIVGRRLPALVHRLVAAVGVGGIAAIGLLLASTLSSGALGRLRLADLGPPPVAVAAATLLLVALGACLAVLAHRQASPANDAADQRAGVAHVDGRAHVERTATVRVHRGESRTDGQAPRLVSVRSRRLAERATIVYDDQEPT